MDENKYFNYLQDLSMLLIDKAKEAKKDHKENPKDGFKTGCSFAYYDMIDVMKQQATAFGINLKELGLDEIDPDKDLL